MFDKKATLLTSTISSSLGIVLTNFYNITIQPLIRKELEIAYLQGRKDQLNKVTFELNPDGSLKFKNK